MQSLSIRPAAARSVAVLPDTEGQFRVLPLPWSPTDPKAPQFASAAEARHFALGLGLARGWEVIDLTAEAAQ